MRPIRLFLILGLPVCAALADTIQLKSGEIIEGKIVSSDATSITIETQFSPTISDQRSIPRTEIRGSAVASGDELAYEKLRDLKLPETALDTRAYDGILSKQLLPFLKQYPTSARLPDVQAEIKSFQNERARIAAGEVKVAGVWYDATTRVAEKYQIDAAAILAALRLDYDAQNFAGVLNGFELLQRSYPASTAFVDAIPLAQKSLQKFNQQLVFSLSNLPQTRAARQATIDRTPIEQRAPIQAAITAEDARADALAAAAQRANRHFFVILPYDEKGIKSMQLSARQMATQIAPLDVKKLTRGAQLIRQVNAELAGNQLPAATATLAQLKTTWSEYEGFNRLERQLTDAQKDTQASSERQAKHIDEQRAAPTPKP